MTERCRAYSGGYACLKDKDHGMLHFDGEEFWVYFPRTDDELAGREPYSGYLLLTDTALRGTEKK